MASTQQKRLWWADWRCNPTKMVTVAFPGPDRDWNLPVADAAVPAFQLFASLMRRHNYLFREVSGGTYNCRKIAGTDAWSLHAYGIAIDLNPSKNPFGTSRHNYPQGFIDDVLATGLFKWLNTFDPMHWEIDVPPSAIGDDMPLNAADLAAIKQLLNEHDETFNYTNSVGHTRRMSRLSVNSTWHVDISGRRAMDWQSTVGEISTPDLQSMAKAVNDELDRRQRARLG